MAGATPGTFGATTTLSGGGLYNPEGLAFDARGDLFAGDFTGNSITEFTSTGAGTFGTGITFATGGTLNGPYGLAFDARGDLFAVNERGNSITEFAFNSAAGTFGAGQTVETGLSDPRYLAFSPVPAVPEASTTVSLGLLLALGMGGMVVAARRKRRA